MIGNATAAMYAKRADIQLKLKRPCSAIIDCNVALELNPDSAKAYRTRGTAYRRLGKWEEAFDDLVLAQKLDFDDNVVDIQKFVADKRNAIFEQKNAQRIKEDEIKQQRFEENLLRRRKAHEERAQA